MMSRLAIRRRRSAQPTTDRGIVSSADWTHRKVRWTVQSIHGITLIFLLIVGLGPLIFLARAAITPIGDTYAHPLGLLTNAVDFGLLRSSWDRTKLGTYFANTFYMSVGYWLTQVFVATTAGYALSILRPPGTKILNALVLGTLFVPAVVLLVPLYATVRHMPIPFVEMLNITLPGGFQLGNGKDISGINWFWAIWFPAGANAFNVVLVKRFFDNLPREILEAAQVDGAGPFRLFWSLCLPMSKPIIGVISVFAIVNAWKDYLWPSVVLKSPDVLVLSVRLPQIRGMLQDDLYLAALAMTTLIPVAVFLLFQGMFLRGTSLSGAVKG
jgi:multiple sugar transport system permease protein